MRNETPVPQLREHGDHAVQFDHSLVLTELLSDELLYWKCETTGSYWKLVFDMNECERSCINKDINFIDDTKTNIFLFFLNLAIFHPVFDYSLHFSDTFLW